MQAPVVEEAQDSKMSRLFRFIKTLAEISVEAPSTGTG
jgi:hypothetical protein